MSLKNSDTTYGSVAKFFHWTLSLLILGMLCVGFIMIALPKETAIRGAFFTAHKLTGLTLLSLMLLRLMWTLANPKPKLPAGTPRWEIAAEHLTHGLFYLVLLAMPFSGWVMSTAAGHAPNFFGLFKIPLPGIAKDKPLAELASTIHYILAWTIVVLVSLHILAALKHHFINKDNVLIRMMPGNGVKSSI